VNDVNESTRATIEVRVDDLAFVTAGAVVRPTTSDLGAPTALLRRLELAAGEALAHQLRGQEALPVGSAVVTGAGELSSELLIHAVVSSQTESVSVGSVRRALTSALQRAADWGVESLAIAPFGLGAGNLDPDESAAVTAEVLTRQLREPRHPAHIVIVAENEAEADAFRARLAPHLREAS